MDFVGGDFELDRVDDGDESLLEFLGVEVDAVDAAEGGVDLLGKVGDTRDGGFFGEDTEILLGFWVTAVFGGVGAVGR